MNTRPLSASLKDRLRIANRGSNQQIIQRCKSPPFTQNNFHFFNSTLTVQSSVRSSHPVNTVEFVSVLRKLSSHLSSSLMEVVSAVVKFQRTPDKSTGAWSLGAQHHRLPPCQGHRGTVLVCMTHACGCKIHLTQQPHE